MQFDSLTFALFFPLVLLAYNVVGTWGARKNLLLVASYLFYAAWNPLFLPLLIGSSTLDWWLARRMDRAATQASRKHWLLAILILNFGVLGYFKYSFFLLGNAAEVLQLVGIAWTPPAFDIILPLGISFYTFHSLSYCIDIYRRKFAPTDNWRDYALYVAFFPQLVAGPIVRWTQMRDQLETPRGTNADQLGLGLALMVLGLFLKISLADAIFAPAANAFFDSAAGATPAAAWAGIAAFTGQIYCDFAGYSTCAIGAAIALGFRLPINFDSPYAALGFSDFWRRWHISLSSWLRDYLYVSLGGNRHGMLLTWRNLMLTMLIGGLWHGAAWTFVIWGGLHGLYLILERSLAPAAQRWLPTGNLLLKLAYGAATLVAVMFAWVWFRAPDLSTGWHITWQLLHLHELPATPALNAEQQLACLALAAIVIAHALSRHLSLPALLRKTPAAVTVAVLAALMALIVLSPGNSHAFIYFQF